MTPGSTWVGRYFLTGITDPDGLVVYIEDFNHFDQAVEAGLEWIAKPDSGLHSIQIECTDTIPWGIVWATGQGDGEWHG